MRAAIFAMLVGFVTHVFAGHPLMTEDTETLGEGNHQVEAAIDAARDRQGAARLRAEQFSLAYAYGLSKSLDIQLGIPRHRQRADDGAGTTTVVRGSGDTTIDLKWQFHEQDGLTLGFKPGLTLPTGDASRRLGQGKANFGAVVMAGYESGSWKFNGHLGAQRNQNSIGERRSLYQVSGSVSWEAAERFWLSAEAGKLRQADPALRVDPVFLGVAAIWGPTKNVDVDVGIRRGLNGIAADRVIGVGVTVRW